MEGGLIVRHPGDLTGGRWMLVHDGLHRVPRGLVAGYTCGGGRGIFVHGWGGLVLGRRIISAGVVLVRRRSSCAIACRVWPVVRPATRNMFYRVFPRVLQSDALAVVVVCGVMDWWGRDWCCLI